MCPKSLATIGKDYNGLDVRLRFRGTNRADNVLATPEDERDIWSLRLGALLLGEQTTMCFFSCRIDSSSVPLFDGATSDHNFGHAWIHCIDRIQARNLNVFGVVNVYLPTPYEPSTVSAGEGLCCS